MTKICNLNIFLLLILILVFTYVININKSEDFATQTPTSNEGIQTIASVLNNGQGTMNNLTINELLTAGSLKIGNTKINSDGSINIGTTTISPNGSINLGSTNLISINNIPVPFPVASGIVTFSTNVSGGTASGTNLINCTVSYGGTTFVNVAGSTAGMLGGGSINLTAYINVTNQERLLGIMTLSSTIPSLNIQYNYIANGKFFISVKSGDLSIGLGSIPRSIPFIIY